MADAPNTYTASTSHTDRNAHTRRVALGVSYDGSGFRGFAAQPGRRTIAGELVRALQTIFGKEPRIVCAGRTDAGVHATAQVAHVDLEATLLTERFAVKDDEVGVEIPDLAHSLSALAGPELSVWRAITAPAGFDARRSATSRRYRYEIDTGLRADPLRRMAAWHVPEPLDLSAMRIATDAVIGEHDFAGFCRRPPGDDGAITRRVLDARLDASRARGIDFEIEANAFCHQMVRSIVGTLVAAGRGSRRPSEMMRLLAAGSRSGAADPAPPQGLYLIAVSYPAELTGNWS